MDTMILIGQLFLVVIACGAFFFFWSSGHSRIATGISLAVAVVLALLVAWVNDVDDYVAGWVAPPAQYQPAGPGAR